MSTLEDNTLTKQLTDVAPIIMSTEQLDLIAAQRNWSEDHKKLVGMLNRELFTTYVAVQDGISSKPLSGEVHAPARQEDVVTPSGKVFLPLPPVHGHFKAPYWKLPGAESFFYVQHGGNVAAFIKEESWVKEELWILDPLGLNEDEMELLIPALRVLRFPFPST